MLNRRIAAAMPFAILGALAIVAGGGISAAWAAAPSRHLMWLVAYLVLVVGVMQVALGAGQAWLAASVPSPGVVWSQWLLFNLGNAGVVCGTLAGRAGMVMLGSVLFVAALAGFLLGVRRSRHRVWLLAWRALLALLFVSACIGIVLSRHTRGGL